MSWMAGIGPLSLVSPRNKFGEYFTEILQGPLSDTFYPEELKDLTTMRCE